MHRLPQEVRVSFLEKVKPSLAPSQSLSSVLKENADICRTNGEEGELQGGASVTKGGACGKT